MCRTLDVFAKWENDMAEATDPVCGMTVDPATAPAATQHKGRTYVFCSEACRVKFEAEPEKYAR